jgi:cytochrome c oxidase subunit 3
MEPAPETAPAAGPEHAPFLAHQFESPEQQFRAAKLGMWIFLATEILMFSGLFCAYAVYRQGHPEIFEQASQFLNWKLGALNTIVLICSSLTMAWAVHSASSNQRRLSAAMLALTLVLGLCFLVVKAIEYRDKWQHHLLPGTHFKPHREHAEAAPVAPPAPEPAKADAKSEAWTGPAPGTAPRGLAKESATDEAAPGELPQRAHIFFGIYFVMTGLHGLHVLAGMAVIAWMLRRTLRGDFSSAYYSPVDITGLFWHLVDVVWIYLFPLLYLIH